MDKRNQSQINHDYRRIAIILGKDKFNGTLQEFCHKLGLSYSQILTSLKGHDETLEKFQKKFGRVYKKDKDVTSNIVTDKQDKRIDTVVSSENKTKNIKKITVDTCFILNVKDYRQIIEQYLKNGCIILITTQVIRELRNLQYVPDEKNASDYKRAIALRARNFFRWAIENEDKVIPVDSDAYEGRNADETIIMYCKENNVSIFTCDKEMCLIARAKGVRAKYFSRYDEDEINARNENSLDVAETTNKSQELVTLQYARHNYDNFGDGLFLDVIKQNGKDILVEIINRDLKGGTRLKLNDELYIATIKDGKRVNFTHYKIVNITATKNAYIIYSLDFAASDVWYGTYKNNTDIPKRYIEYIEKFKNTCLKGKYYV